MRASSYWMLGARTAMAHAANDCSTSTASTRRRGVPVSGSRCVSTNIAADDVCTEQQANNDDKRRPAV